MKHIRKLRDASAERIKQAKPSTPISDEISAFYDSRRLTEEDVDHLAEIYSEGRTYNRNARTRSTHE
jgi:ubiquinone biosynthesis protein UbiJ